MTIDFCSNPCLVGVAVSDSKVTDFTQLSINTQNDHKTHSFSSAISAVSYTLNPLSQKGRAQTHRNVFGCIQKYQKYILFAK